MACITYSAILSSLALVSVSTWPSCRPSPFAPFAPNAYPQVVSTMATSSIEEVAQASSSTFLLFQLYVIKNRDIVKSWVHDAERLGYKAIMVTVDAQKLGKREADERNRYLFIILGCAGGTA